MTTPDGDAALQAAPSEFFASLLALRSKLLYAGAACGRWGIDHNSDTAIWVHLVTKGQAWVHYASRQQPVALATGDVVVFMPHADKHYLSYSPHELVFDDPNARKVRFDEGTIGLVCAHIELGSPRAALWRLLPPEIFAPARTAQPMLSSLVRHAIDEAHQERFGSLPVIERLCDSIFVLTIRHCIEQGHVTQGGLAALSDRRVEAVLGMIQREPWCRWTVEGLCAKAGISRTVLTERFVAMLGCAPGEYLARWRMQTAANLLVESALPVEAIAERCGYASVSAFARGFKKSLGTSPGAYRVVARSGARQPPARR
jgi:AraC-like DNA-binding protein